MSKKEKISEENQVINGPFEVVALDGEKRYGLSDGVIRRPLAIQVIGSDGLPPRDEANNTVSLSVQFEVLEVPRGSATNLVSGTRQQMIVKTDTDGRASISAQLGGMKGRYIFGASLSKFEDSSTVNFTALTEGVTAQIVSGSIKDGIVGRRLRFKIKALDWLGAPVNDAQIGATIIPSFQSELVASFDGKFLRKGIYSLAVSTKVSGKRSLEIIDSLSDTRLLVAARFMPAAVRRLNFLPTKNAREAAPFNETLVEVVASDRFGNFAPDVTIEWQKSSGTIVEVISREGVSASINYTFGNEPEVKIVAKAGNKKRALKLNLPGVFFRFAEKDDFTFTGSPFKVWVDVFPPAGGGTLHSTFVKFKEPTTAECISVLPSHTENGIAPPEIITHGNGITDICNEGMDLELPEEQIPYTIAELTYNCFVNEEACFQALEAAVVISKSPPERVKLHPGVKKCRPQKLKDPKTLCLNICIANKPGGKTLVQLKAEAKAQVDRAQAIFNENISKCCPKIVIKACYNEIPWADYQGIVRAGEVRNALEQFDYTTPKSNDKTKDAFKLSNEVKKLMKKCRKEKCISIYLVPDHRFKTNRGWSRTSNGCGMAPNDFPETTAAAGSGPSVILSQGLNVDDNTLAHELGHMLIDLPRDKNGGSEHVANSNRDRLMKISAPGGRKLTKEECSSIFGNIDKYGGKCD